MEADLQKLQVQIRVMNARIAELEQQGTDKDELIRKLQHQLSQALRRQYGQKADRVDPNQLLLDICTQLQAVAHTPHTPEPPPSDRPSPPRKRGTLRARRP